jgi:hypothetical protein
MLNVVGSVHYLRTLGFDVFDDVFDNHEYDKIQDPWVRMTRVVMLARQVCNLDLIALRKQHWQRLEKNAELIKQIHTTGISKHTEQLNRLMYDNF